MSRASPKPMTAPCASCRCPPGPRPVQRRPTPQPRHHHREAAAICFSIDGVVIFFLGAEAGMGAATHGRSASTSSTLELRRWPPVCHEGRSAELTGLP
jgi:hypothetical protein